MIRNTIKPEAAELAATLDEALEGRESPEFVTAYLSGLASILQSDPRQYRSYGPYWWPIKELLVSKGLAPAFVGQELELGTLEHYRYKEPALSLVAGWIYQQDRLQEGKLRCASHQLELPGGELYEYELADQEIELHIAR